MRIVAQGMLCHACYFSSNALDFGDEDDEEETEKYREENALTLL